MVICCLKIGFNAVCNGGGFGLYFEPINRKIIAKNESWQGGDVGDAFDDCHYHCADDDHRADVNQPNAKYDCKNSAIISMG